MSNICPLKSQFFIEGSLSSLVGLPPPPFNGPITKNQARNPGTVEKRIANFDGRTDELTRTDGLTEPGEHSVPYGKVQFICSINSNCEISFDHLKKTRTTIVHRSVDEIFIVINICSVRRKDGKKSRRMD